MELLVPTVSDVLFKYNWPIQKYKKTVSKTSCLDSPTFEVNINGIHSSWSLSIRFWKGPEGLYLSLAMSRCSEKEYPRVMKFYVRQENNKSGGALPEHTELFGRGDAAGQGALSVRCSQFRRQLLGIL